MYVSIIGACRENYPKYQVMNGQRFLMLGTLVIRSNEILDQRGMSIVCRSIMYWRFSSIRGFFYFGN